MEFLPSRTSRWYACRYRRTCRSSGLLCIVSAMFEAEIEACRRLTGGCGLARIDVADNDHVDVHLFLTAARRRVSRESIKIALGTAMMLLMQRRWQIMVDSPHLDGVGFCRFCVWLCVFFGKKLNLGTARSVAMVLMMDLMGSTYCTE
jgi:hypothetical protein